MITDSEFRAQFLHVFFVQMKNATYKNVLVMPQGLIKFGSKGYFVHISCFYVYNLTDAFGDCTIKP